jgi:WD40 repeat protein
VTFESNVLALKIRLKKLVVALSNRVYLIDFLTLEVLHIIPTFRFPEEEPYNLLSLSNDLDNLLLACPTVEIGHVLVVNVDSEKQRRIRAHQSSFPYLFNLVLNSIAITLSGDKIATCSEKGMNIRVFNTANGDLLQEVRRGNEYGMVYSLSFSRAGNWLACTSDSNIVHVFASTPCPETVPHPPFSVSGGTSPRYNKSTATPSPGSTSSAD